MFGYDTLFRVYGYDLDVFRHLIDGKVRLVNLMRGSFSFKEKAIPVTFDLSKYATVYEWTNEDGTKNKRTRYRPGDVFTKIYCGEMKFTSKDRKELLKHLLFLRGQVEEFDTVNKLNEAHDKIAAIIKNNFTIEEIVSNEDDID